MASIYSFSAHTLGGQEVSLEQYRGKVLLIVNTASECGFTPQYAGLQKLFDAYSARGLTVLGFPCNQFGKQEPGDASAIGDFCQKNYGVTFPMFDKIDVNGSNAHPLFRYLTEEAPGLLGLEGIKWNFTKFLIGRDGSVVKRYAPLTKPESITEDIEKQL
ncbi:Hydroperoxy fatty acid reductase gpx1 [Burkholderia sp. AD24]|nr:Hydroperoxy fatty acid reductase gpx1 [Burkholderia sp. AD24]